MTSEFVFSCPNRYNKKLRTELFVAVENGKPQFFVSDDSEQIIEALRKDIKEGNHRTNMLAKSILDSIKELGFRTFSDV